MLGRKHCKPYSRYIPRRPIPQGLFPRSWRGGGGCEVGIGSPSSLADPAPHHFRFSVWDDALGAAEFAVLVAFGLLSILLAAFAALALVRRLFRLSTRHDDPALQGHVFVLSGRTGLGAWDHTPPRLLRPKMGPARTPARPPHEGEAGLEMRADRHRRLRFCGSECPPDRIQDIRVREPDVGGRSSEVTA